MRENHRKVFAASLLQRRIPCVHLQAARILYEPDSRSVFRKASHDVDRAIAAHAVDDENLDLAVHATLREQAHQALADVLLLVVRRNDGCNRYTICAYNVVNFFASLVH